MPERPLQCCECRHKTSITFIQVSLNSYQETALCNHCPLIAQLIGDDKGNNQTPIETTSYGICCGHCSTTMESVQMGSQLGCANCYEVFSDVISLQILKVPISPTLHSGRSVGEKASINPTLRLYALNEALQETLLREEYEEAARIRDEISSIMKFKTGHHEAKNNLDKMGEN